MTSSPASSSSIPVAQSIWIYRIQPPSEHAFTLAWIQVHFWGIPEGLPHPLPANPLALGLLHQIQMLCKLMLGFFDWYKGNGYQSWADSVSTAAASTCTNMLPPQSMYLFCPIGTHCEPNNVPASRSWDCLMTKWCSCHTEVKQSDNEVTIHSHMGIDTSIQPLFVLNTCGSHWSPESSQVVHPLVAPWILRILTTK